MSTACHPYQQQDSTLQLCVRTRKKKKKEEKNSKDKKNVNRILSRLNDHRQLDRVSRAGMSRPRCCPTQSRQPSGTSSRHAMPSIISFCCTFSLLFYLILRYARLCFLMCFLTILNCRGFHSFEVCIRFFAPHRRVGWLLARAPGCAPWAASHQHRFNGKRSSGDTIESASFVGSFYQGPIVVVFTST